jgi:hypothetical protein
VGDAGFGQSAGEFVERIVEGREDDDLLATAEDLFDEREGSGYLPQPRDVSSNAPTFCLVAVWTWRDVPEKPLGKFGRPLSQSMTYHDTPSQPVPEMRYLDASVKPSETHTYSIITVNGVGLRSGPSARLP